MNAGTRPTQAEGVACSLPKAKNREKRLLLRSTDSAAHRSSWLAVTVAASARIGMPPSDHSSTVPSRQEPTAAHSEGWSARWENLILLTFDRPSSLLGPLVPAGTELDSWQGSTILSLVGFRFADTRGS